MAYKIGIAISGAVSLGSYEAGALYEIIHALKTHNQQNKEKNLTLKKRVKREK